MGWLPDGEILWMDEAAMSGVAMEIAFRTQFARLWYQDFQLIKRTEQSL